MRFEIICVVLSAFNTAAGVSAKFCCNLTAMPVSGQSHNHKPILLLSILHWCVTNIVARVCGGNEMYHNSRSCHLR